MGKHRQIQKALALYMHEHLYCTNTWLGQAKYCLGLSEDKQQIICSTILLTISYQYFKYRTDQDP